MDIVNTINRYILIKDTIVIDDRNIKPPIIFKKTITKQTNELNFYIPEKWDYNMEL